MPAAAARCRAHHIQRPTNNRQCCMAVQGPWFTLVASCFLGAFPPVLLRAVCFVRAILVVARLWWVEGACNGPRRVVCVRCNVRCARTSCSRPRKGVPEHKGGSRVDKPQAWIGSTGRRICWLERFLCQCCAGVMHHEDRIADYPNAQHSTHSMPLCSLSCRGNVPFPLHLPR